MLNLWKETGKSISYNPLPTDWKLYGYIPSGNFIITFRAKSASSAFLTIADRAANGVDISKLIGITTEFKIYRVEFTLTKPDDFFINSNGGNIKHDIIIEDIKINYKPLTISRSNKTPIRVKKSISNRTPKRKLDIKR